MLGTEQFVVHKYIEVFFKTSWDGYLSKWNKVHALRGLKAGLLFSAWSLFSVLFLFMVLSFHFSLYLKESKTTHFILSLWPSKMVDTSHVNCLRQQIFLSSMCVLGLFDLNKNFTFILIKFQPVSAIGRVLNPLRRVANFFSFVFFVKFDRLVQFKSFIKMLSRIETSNFLKIFPKMDTVKLAHTFWQ